MRTFFLKGICSEWRLSVAAAVVLIFCAPGIASAQTPTWSGSDSYQAWVGFNGDFYAPGANGGQIFTEESVKVGGSSWSSFWEEAEEIEDADDAYYYSYNNYPTHDHSAYVNEITALCTGFIDNMPSKWIGSKGGYDWSGDRFNDDLAWAVAAFTRAYQITKDQTFLSAAEENFNTIWNRAQAEVVTVNGVKEVGLAQAQPPSGVTPKNNPNNWSPNLDAPANFGFVIAGYLLWDNTGNSTYKTEADEVYAWAMANLYTTSANNGGPCTGHTSLTCGKIRDANNTAYNTGVFACTSGTNPACFPTTGIGPTDFAYNYGIAVQSNVRYGDNTVAQYITNYLMYNMNNSTYPYAGTYSYGGTNCNILPNWSGSTDNNNSNDAGYNGIALRGVAFGLSRSALNATSQAWAQANVQAAWNQRNSNNVTWANWVSPTTGDQYSWGDSAALAGLLDVPAPGGYPQ